jgi:hypothetical protein
MAMKNRWISLLTCLVIFSLSFHSTAPEARAAAAKKDERVELQAGDTAQLKKLIEGKRIEAIFTNGSRARGRVKQVSDGSVTLDVERSEGQPALAKGQHTLQTTNFSTITITKRKGKMRAILGTALGFAGLGFAALVVATEFEGESWNETYAAITVASIALGAVAGYFWGRSKDKKQITIVIK